MVAVPIERAGICFNHAVTASPTLATKSPPRAEISRILLGELALLTATAIPLGLFFGNRLAGLEADVRSRLGPNAAGYAAEGWQSRNRRTFADASEVRHIRARHNLIGGLHFGAQDRDVLKTRTSKCGAARLGRGLGMGRGGRSGQAKQRACNHYLQFSHVNSLPCGR